MYNPFSGWKVTGTWADHLSYSLGGIDQPLPFNTALPAPASGTLRTSGGSGEFKAGHVGSAGRRAILMLDKPVMGLVAIVFQHLSAFGTEGHYDEGQTLGRSGASTIRANGTVNEYGGDIHLHSHGLLANGARVDWFGYVPFAGGSSAPASSHTIAPTTPVNPARRKGAEDMAVQYLRNAETKQIGRFGAGVKVFGPAADYTRHRIICELDARMHPGTGIVVPPNENSANNFVNISDADWKLQIAIHGGTY